MEAVKDIGKSCRGGNMQLLTAYKAYNFLAPGQHAAVSDSCAAYLFQLRIAQASRHGATKTLKPWFGMCRGIMSGELGGYLRSASTTIFTTVSRLC